LLSFHARGFVLLGKIIIIIIIVNNSDQVWYTDANFHSEHGNLTKNRDFSNSRWRTDAILNIVFWLYLGALLVDQREIRKGDKESHTKTGHVTKTAIFENSRWRTAAILKIALSPCPRRELSYFDQIWDTGANFHSQHGN